MTKEDIMAEKVVFTSTVTERNGEYHIDIEELGIGVSAHTRDTALWAIAESVKRFCAELVRRGENGSIAQIQRTQLARRAVGNGFEIRAL